jgi:hypothetical protein
MNTQSDMNDGPGAEVPAEVMKMAGERVGGMLPEVDADTPNYHCKPDSEQEVPAAPMMGPGYVKPKQTGRAMRSQLPDDPETRARVAASEERREKAYHARYEWQGREVVWSLRREGLWMRMRSALGYPDLTVLYTRDEAMAVLSDAMMVLFLGLHEPKAIEFVTGSAQRFQQAVEEWADEGGGILMSERKAACVLFHRIVGDGLECIPRPAPTGPGERVPGN